MGTFKIQSEYRMSEERLERIWRKTDYSNFFVASFMKTTEGSTMITYGFAKKISLVDDKWVEEVKKELQRQDSYY